jgi:hypothetical protein
VKGVYWAALDSSKVKLIDGGGCASDMTKGCDLWVKMEIYNLEHLFVFVLKSQIDKLVF